MKRSLILICLALCFGSTSNAAGVLRCGGKIIDVGVPAAYVLAACGAPENQLVQEAPARARTLMGSRLTGIAVSEHWVYDRGWGRFPAVLFFFDGTLRRIDFLPHRP